MEDYIKKFIEQICPTAPELYAASFDERKCIEDATDLIKVLRGELESFNDPTQERELSGVCEICKERALVRIDELLADNAKLKRVVKEAFTQCAIYSGILEWDDLMAVIKKELE